MKYLPEAVVVLLAAFVAFLAAAFSQDSLFQQHIGIGVGCAASGFTPAVPSRAVCRFRR